MNTTPPTPPAADELVRYCLADGVATLYLNHGKVNAISPAVITAFNQALDQAEADQAVVIITGRPGIFSGGFDLKVLQSGPQAARDLVAQGFLLTRRLLCHPRPVIMACSGHAVAKGAFLLLAADYRIGVDGAFAIALNEVKIGMTMPHAAVVMARDRLSPAAFQRAVLLSETFTPASAVDAGFLDQVVHAEALMDTARSKATELQALDAQAHRQSKLRVRQPLLDALDAAVLRDQATAHA
jgi:enoyl-CoA hydratase